MDKEKKNLIYTFLYVLALYLGIKMIPFERWIAIEWVVALLKTFTYLLLLLLALWECRKADMEPEKNECHLSYFLLLPLLIGPCSNLGFGLLFHSEPDIHFDSSFAFTLIETLECTAIEEILFRWILLSFLVKAVQGKKNPDILVILLDSLLFSLMHAINFFGNNPLNVLLQMGYTFVLGWILSTIAMSFETPIVPVLGHFLFNFLNTDVAVRIYSYDMSKPSYLVYSGVLSFLVIIYVGLLYLITKNKQRKHEYATKTTV